MMMTYEGYYFEPKIAVFGKGLPVYCLDHYQVELKQPIPNAEGWQMDPEDRKRLSSVLPGQETIGDGTESLEQLFSSKGFEVVFVEEFLVVKLVKDAEFPDVRTMEEDLLRKEMAVGDYYGTYWHEGICRWTPYRMYVPSTFDPEKKNPLLVGIHGGMGSPDSIFRSTKDQIKEYVEQEGYLFLAPDGVTKNSSYGCVTAPYGMPGAVCDMSCPENPQHLTEKQLHWLSMGETGLTQLLERIVSQYSVDEDTMFLMGNSMGGMGTLHYASKHPKRFKKICPAGAAPDMRIFDCEPLKNIPQLYVAGELDSHGVKWLAEAAAIMKEKGCPVTYREVKGGTHGDAWVKVLPEIFEFFRS